MANSATETGSFSTNYARFTTQDPLAEKTPHLSPYAYCAGNPVRFVDPTGMDWYILDRNGSISLWKNTEDSFDRLYSNSDYWPINSQKFIQIGNKDILPSLAIENEEGISKVFLSRNSDSQSLHDLFFFVSDFSDVEWGLYTSKEGTSLGTAHKVAGTGVGGWSNYVSSKPYSKIHSHPNIDVTDKAELDSMGFFFKDNAYDKNGNLLNWDYSKLNSTSGDWINYIHDYRLSGGSPTISKVYFPNSGRIYNIRYNVRPTISRR